MGTRARLRILEPKPAFRDRGGDGCNSCGRYYEGEMMQVAPGTARLVPSAHGRLVRTIEYATVDSSLRQVGDGIIALFEATSSPGADGSDVRAP